MSHANSSSNLRVNDSTRLNHHLIQEFMGQESRLTTKDILTIATKWENLLPFIREFTRTNEWPCDISFIRNMISEIETLFVGTEIGGRTWSLTVAPIKPAYLNLDGDNDVPSNILPIRAFRDKIEFAIEIKDKWELIFALAEEFTRTGHWYPSDDNGEHFRSKLNEAEDMIGRF